MKQILDQLKQLGHAKNLSTGRLNIEPAEGRKDIQTHTELLDIINTFLPADGWISYQSKVEQFQNLTALTQENEETGFILQAEFVQTADNNKSLHIRQNGMGGWIANHITQVAIEESETGILETSSFITMPDESSVNNNTKNSANDSKKAEGKLHYQSYWKPDKSGGGYQKALSRLFKVELAETDNSKPENQQESSNAST